MQKKKDFRKILDHDNPTKDQMRQVINMAVDPATNLILPKELAERCQICGGFIKEKAKYYGQEFCRDCVMAMRKGARINE